MTEMWKLYLAAATTSRDLLARPEVAERWNGPSALPEFGVAGLAAHLSRMITSPPRILANLLAEDTPRMDLATWFDHGSSGKSDESLDSAGHRAIRANAAEVAAAGHAEILRDVDAALDRLAERLPTEDPERWVDVFGKHALRLNDFLLTRLNELVVHGDDLAVSVGIDTPEMPDEAVDAVLAALLSHAVRRKGRLAVVRAFTRKERATESIAVY